MGEKVGARVDVDKAPLKYEGLSYTEIWISEAHERMILAVPPEHWPALQALCASEDVEATAIGQFEATGRLRLLYHDHPVGDLDLGFLHHGRPEVVRQAASPAAAGEGAGSWRQANKDNYTEDLLKILASYNVCS